jgi:hypothetical protein
VRVFGMPGYIAIFFCDTREALLGAGFQNAPSQNLDVKELKSQNL